MSRSAEHGCLERMCDIIAVNENALVDMVMTAVRRDAVDHAPRSPRAWRESVQGLSDAVFQAVYGHLEVSADGMRRDPVVAYGIVRGRIQGERGVMPGDWSVLLRYYRQAYLELVKSADFPPEELVVCRRFIGWFFDRLEDGFKQGHPGRPGERRTAEADPLTP